MIETLERTKEKIGSDAFRIEYEPNIPDRVLIDDIVSYLGEYRFNLQKYSYRYLFKEGKLRDPHRGESMEDLSQRAIDRKIAEWKSPLREQAEKSGFISLDKQLESAKEGDTVVWASPPGAKEDGYGDYGFIFIGNVVIKSLLEKEVKMTAIRLEDPKIGEFNKALNLITGEKAENTTPEDFLRNPKAIRERLEEKYIDAILELSFDLKPDKEKQGKFKEIIKEMDFAIYDYISIVRSGTRDEKINGLNALENYFLMLKAQKEHGAPKKVLYQIPVRLKNIIVDYNHKPPAVAGSCGSSGNKNGFTTSNVLSLGSNLNNLSEEQEWFTCPKCDYKADGPIGNKCPGCGLTKEAYAKETGVSCD